LTGGARTVRAAFVAGGIVVFILLATANAGGYRFGVSDQAFYEPAIRAQMDPALFPHDRPLLEAQSKLMAADKILGRVAQTLHLRLPPLFFAIYVLSLGLLAVGGVAVARALGFSWWATAAFLFALTLRHRIPKTGANTLESYMHTRQLAFAIGALGIACLLRRRWGWMVAAIAAAAVLHPTTGLWFAVCLMPAAFVAAPAPRKWLPFLIAGGLIAALVLLTRGSFAGRLVIMDQPWLDVLADKDYLFPTGWPLYAWMANLAYAPIVWGIYAQRTARGVAVAGERALAVGVVALLLVFLISVPLTAMHIALAVQLQVTRVFWVMDFLATAYLVWWLSSAVTWRVPASRRRPAAALVCFAILSLGRGYYVLRDQGADRGLVSLDIPATEWVDVMQWLRAQPPGWNILADPAHAWKYGLSVRVAAERDTVLEAIKDSALALYDRDIAMRVSERSEALRDFDDMSGADFRALAVKYDVHAVVLANPRTVDLPVLYRNSGFTIYGLR
jgi:hypothetical protein